jgi:hypothetical protein
VEAMSWEQDLTDQNGLRKWLGEVPGQFWGQVESLIKKEDDAIPEYFRLRALSQ